MPLYLFSFIKIHQIISCRGFEIIIIHKNNFSQACEKLSQVFAIVDLHYPW